MGPSILEGQAGLGLAVRAHVGKSWLVEWGGLVPHRVSGYAEDTTHAVSGTDTIDTAANVESFSEMHWTLSYRLHSWNERRTSVYGGAGLSLGFVTNRMNTWVTSSPGNVQSSTQNAHRTRISPRVQLGAATSFTPHTGFSLNVAWVHYANEETRSGQPHDLDFGGLLIEPMLQWQF